MHQMCEANVHPILFIILVILIRGYELTPRVHSLYKLLIWCLKTHNSYYVHCNIGIKVTKLVYSIFFNIQPDFFVANLDNQTVFNIIIK